MQVDNTGKTVRKVPLSLPATRVVSSNGITMVGPDLISGKLLKVGLGGTNGRRKRDVGLLPLRSKLALCVRSHGREQWATLDMRVSVL